MLRRCIGLLLATTALPSVAQAQTDTQNHSGIEEIVVTAQKRSENVQSVPIAISAFTANAPGERAVGDVSALSAISPNVTLDSSTPFSGSSAVLGASIRALAWPISPSTSILRWVSMSMASISPARWVPIRICSM
jgi:iron complex outermembrane receptor protein